MGAFTSQPEPWYTWEPSTTLSRFDSVLDPESSKNRRTILDLLDELGKPKLEEEFKVQFKNLTGKSWDELLPPLRGQQFRSVIGQAGWKNAFGFKGQPSLVASGNIKLWDITLLAAAIKIADENQKPSSRRPAALEKVNALKDIRNAACHTTGSAFSNKKFDELLDKAKETLERFGYTSGDVDGALQEIHGGRPVFICEAPRKEFCGREDVLSKCKKAIKRCNLEHTVKDKIVVIYGFGGMGKSQVARCMGQRLCSKQPHYPDLSFNVIYLFDAQTECSLRKGFKNLAISLGIEHKLSRSPELGLQDISKIYIHLSTWYHRKVLLIFDNAERMEAANGLFGLNSYLEPDPGNRCEKPVFLVTSRVPWHKWVKHSNCIKIDALTEDDSRTCLLHYMSIPENNQLEEPLETAIDYFVEYTRGHPLGLSLIGSAMAKQAEDITPDRSSWVEMVNAYLKLLRAKPVVELSEEDKYKQHVTTICEYAMAQIDDGSSEGIPAIVLGVSAWLNPDDIDLELVQDICCVDEEKYEHPYDPVSQWNHLNVDILKAIILLRDFSLVDICTVEPTGSMQLKIHRVVQKCIQEMSLELAPTSGPLHKFLKFLRTTKVDQMRVNDHVRFLLRCEAAEPNPLNPSLIIELASFSSVANQEYHRMISVEAIGTRVLNEDEQNALELLDEYGQHYYQQNFLEDWNLIEKLARALHGRACLSPEWLIEVICEMIRFYAYRYAHMYNVAEVDIDTDDIVLRMCEWILQRYTELPDKNTIRNPKYLLAVDGYSVYRGGKIKHEIIHKVFLGTELEDFWNEYSNFYCHFAVCVDPSEDHFINQWPSGLFPPSSANLFTQSLQSLHGAKLRRCIDKRIIESLCEALLNEASEKPELNSRLLEKTDGIDCALWKFTEIVLHPDQGEMIAFCLICTWLRLFSGDENHYHSYCRRLDPIVEVWLQGSQSFWSTRRSLRETFGECTITLPAYYTERTKTWIKKL